MIPKSNLDDRTFDDIVAEAIRLIPRYCPEWTNHNPTDPGITLVELFAWMTEMTLYRLNKVPEKTYLSLLELMGLSLVAPQSARVVISFFPVEGYQKPVRIKAGTQVAAVVGDSENFVFETERDILVNCSALTSCVNRCGEHWTDFCSDGNLQNFELFDSRNSVEHALYIASPAFKYLETENYVQISFESTREIASTSDEIVNHLYWEYWDGRSWVHVGTSSSVGGNRKKDNTIYISGPLDIQPCLVNGCENIYLRGILTDIPDSSSVLSVKAIELKTIFGGLGFMPDQCLTNSGTGYTLIDMNGVFRIFSENPAYNEIFYMSADEIFKNRGTRVKLVFSFSEVYVAGDENDNALFTYEYWNGSNWSKLSEDSPEFVDGTFGFKQAGIVMFVIPDTMSSVAVNNEEHYWIRVRLLTKDFSIGGTYSQDENGNWVWKFSSKVHSPIFSKIRITYEAKKQPPAAVFSNSNFQWHDLSGLCRKTGEDDKSDVALFYVENEKVPALFLGFSQALVPGDTSLYFRIDENASSKPKPALPSFFSMMEAVQTKQPRLVDLVWESWNGNSWEVISVNDMTDSFHESGFVEFITPKNMVPCSLFGKDCYWLRVRMVSGSFESQPVIQAIIPNSVYARNERTYQNEILGSGTGAPGQVFSIAHVGLLPGTVLYIDEGSIPAANELAMMKKDGITEPYYIEDSAVWVRYREVENFYASDPFSRHYVVDYKTGMISFGDGQHGVNPPRRKFNIKLAEYKAGGGSAGNIAAHTLQILAQSIPFIAGCDNPYPAEGGADMETVDSLKSRAAGVFRSLQRAVTAEDFQWLAREASASVGRAWCLRDKNRKGEICTVVIPVMASGTTYATKLLPSRELLRRVTDYLNGRKLVGTPILVQGPVYRNFSIFLSIIFKSDVVDTERMKKKIETDLWKFFHPLYGDTGSGWSFGKDVTNGSVLKQLEKTDGILSVDASEIYDEDAGVVVEKLVLKDDELPFLSTVRIENRKNME